MYLRCHVLKADWRQLKILRPVEGTGASMWTESESGRGRSWSVSDNTISLRCLVLQGMRSTADEGQTIPEGISESGIFSYLGRWRVRVVTRRGLNRGLAKFTRPS